MVVYLIVAVLLLSFLVASMLNEFYYSVSEKELKRGAQKDSKSYKLTYEVIRHGGIAKFVLGTLSLILFAILVGVLANGLNLWQLILSIIGIFLLYKLFTYENQRISPIANLISPNLAKFIVLLKPYSGFTARYFRKLFPKKSEAELYEKEDLVNLIEAQLESRKNKIEKIDLELAINSLKFSEKIVKDVMTPRKSAKFVRSDEPVSTVLMSELHDSGVSRFPVYMDEKDNIVGTLYLKDLVNRRLSGKVFSAMSEEFFYIDEEVYLSECLQRFLKTKHHIFVVNDTSNEIKGLITLEDVIEQIIGKEIVEETE